MSTCARVDCNMVTRGHIAGELYPLFMPCNVCMYGINKLCSCSYSSFALFTSTNVSNTANTNYTAISQL